MPTGLLFFGMPCPFNKSMVNISNLSFFATDAVLSVVEGEHRELSGSILFFYLCELCVLCGFFSAVNPSN
jgi:hypothetical protein